MPPNGMLTPVLALLTLSALAVWTLHNENEALKSIAEAERSFSRRCGQVGFRQSFLDNFALEGIFYGPEPKNAHEDLSKQPEEPKPKFPPFEWAPAIADVSVAGDLGYTTGPLRFWSEDGSRPVNWGTYFSVWRREPDGRWKVVLDLGVDNGKQDIGDPNKVEFRPAPDFRVGRKAYPNTNGEGETTLMRAEKEFGVRAASTPYAEAVLASGSPNVRVHRRGHLPALGKREIFQVLEGLGTTNLWKPMGAGVAKSGDFGYTYGKYETNLTGGKVRTGYWARVWKRDAGKWQLVADVANGT